MGSLQEAQHHDGEVPHPLSVSLYASCLPLNISSRIWDQYLLDGEVVIIRIGIALLKYFEKTLLRSSYSDCGELLMHMGDQVVEVEFWKIADKVNLTACSFKNHVRSLNLERKKQEK